MLLRVTLTKLESSETPTLKKNAVFGGASAINIMHPLAVELAALVVGMTAQPSPSPLVVAQLMLSAACRAGHGGALNMKWRLRSSGLLSLALIAGATAQPAGNAGSYLMYLGNYSYKEKDPESVTVVPSFTFNGTIFDNATSTYTLPSSADGTAGFAWGYPSPAFPGLYPLKPVLGPFDHGGDLRFSASASAGPVDIQFVISELVPCAMYGPSCSQCLPFLYCIGAPDANCANMPAVCGQCMGLLACDPWVPQNGFSMLLPPADDTVTLPTITVSGGHAEYSVPIPAQPAGAGSEPQFPVPPGTFMGLAMYVRTVDRPVAISNIRASGIRPIWSDRICASSSSILAAECR